MAIWDSSDPMQRLDAAIKTLKSAKYKLEEIRIAVSDVAYALDTLAVEAKDRAENRRWSRPILEIFERHKIDLYKALEAAMTIARDDSNCRADVAWALGNLGAIWGDIRGSDLLTDLLHDPHSFVRECATRALSKLSTNSLTVVVRLFDMLDDQDQTVQREAKDTLLKFIRSANRDVRIAVIERIGRLDWTYTRLGDPDWKIRAATAQHLDRQGIDSFARQSFVDQCAFALQERAMDDSDLLVRTTALESLSTLRTTSAIEALQFIAEYASDSNIRSRAQSFVIGEKRSGFA